MLDVHTIQFAVDPLIVIDAPWPDGRYSLIQATSGCPTGWSSGFIKQDLQNHLIQMNLRASHLFQLWLNVRLISMELRSK